MTQEQSPVLKFPAWLHGTAAAILRKARAEGRWWAREYLKTGAFPQPRQLRPVQPGAARCSPVQPGAARCSPVQPGAARCSPVQPGAARCSPVRSW